MDYTHSDRTSHEPDAQPLPPAEVQALLDAAVGAARVAADHLRSIDRTAIAREDKTSHHDIVTEHDRACERLIVEHLEAAVPGARIVGEEEGEQPRDSAGSADGRDRDESGASGLASRATFYVDPIDGTSNFAAGLPLFCVSIGIDIDGELVGGVIDAPILGQVFTAGPDGAFLGAARLGPGRTRPERDALVLTGFPTPRDLRDHRDVALRGLQEMAETVSAVRHLGSAALELAWVAAGWADATMLSSINPWDVAAGFCLVEKAGGSIRTWPGTLEEDSPAHVRPAYVACAGPERIEVLDAIQDRVQLLRSA